MIVFYLIVPIAFNYYYSIDECLEIGEKWGDFGIQWDCTVGVKE